MTNFWKQLTLQFKPFTVLAPMDGVTDYVFREIIARTAKPDVFYTEFVNTDALLSKGYGKTIPRFKFSFRQRYIVAQIWGTDPKKFHDVAALIKNVGFDGIDINMGCPVRDVMKIGSGSALIKNPGLAKEIICACKEGSPDIPVSVKTRIGVSDIVTQEWISFLLEQKLHALIVHGRTAKELSRVPVHWDEIGETVALRDHISPDTVIVGNGDIVSMDQVRYVYKTHRVDGVMIGKGIFHNPWIFEKNFKEHTTGESLQLLLDHTKLYCQTYPEKHRFAALKKYFKMYVRSFDGADALKKQLMETKTYPDVEKLVKPYV